MKKLGFGCMRLPIVKQEEKEVIDFEQVCKMVDTFLKKGFTYFDTAYMYHNFQSEKTMREALVHRHPREAYQIVTKLPISFLKTEADQERIFAEQLDNVGVDYFDYYLLHNLNANTYPVASRLDSFGFVSKKKEEGKIKKMGFSFHDTAELLDEILTAHPEVDFVQLQINYIDWDNPGIQSRKCYEVAVKHNKKVIVMEPIKGGTLADVPEKAKQLMKNYQSNLSIASWAIRYAASLENVMMVLSGMSNLEQVLDNISYMEEFVPLNQEEYQILNQVVQIIHESVLIPCTSCQYCVAGCPKHIPIPNYFALYNAEKQALNKGFSTQSEYYFNFIQTQSKASDCIACRQCEKACPQHLPIVENLKKVVKTFER